jgi:RNA polymerase sigma-70 factor (ECF subfamily)
MSAPERQEEFIRLLSDCQSRVRATVYALIHNMHDVEEVYQQACLVMWRKFDAYEPGTHFVKWACSIAYLEVKKFLAQKHRRTRFSSEFLDGFVAWETGLPVDTGSLSTESLYACMDRLNAADRRLLQLRYWEKRTVLEIAAELGRTPQSVSNTLGRIRSQLLECVKQVRAAEERS